MSTTTYFLSRNKKNIDTFWLKKSTLSRAMDYAPNFKEVGRAYSFRIIHLSVRQLVMLFCA